MTDFKVPIVAVLLVILAIIVIGGLVWFAIKSGLIFKKKSVSGLEEEQPKSAPPVPASSPFELQQNSPERPTPVDSQQPSQMPGYPVMPPPPQSAQSVGGVSGWAPPKAPEPSKVPEQPKAPEQPKTPEQPKFIHPAVEPTHLSGGASSFAPPVQAPYSAPPNAKTPEPARSISVETELSASSSKRTPADSDRTVSQPQSAADADIEEHTVLAKKRRSRASLILPDGSRINLTSDVVVIGRNPDLNSGSKAQYIAVKEDTKTISKNHAILEKRDKKWFLTDLNSTNGVYIVDESGVEKEITDSEEVFNKFSLGDAEFELYD